ncbi:MAG: hypothetical protein VX768_18130 [Planctomycetota bacterium]|nr:hypothetical protein [Planctomycetota bacterium]
MSAQERNPVPGKEESRASLDLVREIYGDRYDAARSQKAKSELAREILDAADLEKDVVATHVLLELGRNIAINAGEVDLTIDFVNRLCDQYQVDAEDQRIKALTRLCAKVPVDQTESMIERVGDACDSAIEKDRYGSIGQLVKALVKLTVRSRESEYREIALEMQKQLVVMRDLHEKVRSYLKNLEKNPADLEANLVVGKYYCFVKGLWTAGMECLAKSGEADFQSIAKLELQSPMTAESRLELADQWWELSARQENEDEKVLMMIRAGSHYSLSAPRLNGLQKAKAVARAAEAAGFGELGVENRKKDSAKQAPSPSRSVALQPVQLSEPVVKYDLPAAFDDVSVGGSGRFLVFQLNTLNKLAFYDLMAGKVTHYVELENADIRFTCGADFLYIGYRNRNTLEKWSLSGFKKVLTTKLPFSNPVDMVITGAGSTGPVYVGAMHSPGLLLNPRNLSPVNYQVVDHVYRKSDARIYGAGPESRMRASFNGQTFTNWSTNVSPAGFRSIVVSGRLVHCFRQHDTMGYLAPSADGELIHTSKGIYTMQTKPFSGKGLFAQSFSVPAVQGNYSVRVVRDDNRKSDASTKSSVTLHVNGEDQPLVTLNDVWIRPGAYADFHTREKVALDKRIFFSPPQTCL